MSGDSAGDELEGARRVELAREALSNLGISDGPRTEADPKKHHHVSQFYLKRFGDRDERVDAIHLATRRRIGPTHVRNVAVVRDFNTYIHVDGHETIAAEHLLSRVEDPVGRLMSRLATSVIPLDRSEHEQLCLWMGMQLTRTLKFRRQIEAIAEQFVNIQLSAPPDGVDSALFGFWKDRRESSEQRSVHRPAEFSVKISQNESVSMMFDVGYEAALALLKRNWTTLRAPFPMFVTTDDPVVLVGNPDGGSHGPGIGVETAEEILIPLDRSTVLIGHRDSSLANALVNLTESEALEVNDHIVDNAFEWIYGHVDDLDELDPASFPSPERSLLSGGCSALDWVGFADGVNGPPARSSPRRFHQARGD